MLHRLELPNRPAELDPYLGVLRGRLEAPARHPGALRRGKGEQQAAHLLVAHPHLVARRDDQAVPTDHQGADRPRPVQRREGLEGHHVARAGPVDQQPADPRLATVDGHQHQSRVGLPEHRADRAGQARRVACIPAVSGLPRQALGAQRHRGRDRAVGEAGQQPARRGIGVTGQRGRHDDGRQDGSGQERMTELLEHHGQLGQREALAAILFGHVEAEPALRGHLLPDGRELPRRPLRHGTGHAGRAVRLGPPLRGEAESLVVLGDGDRH